MMDRAHRLLAKKLAYLASVMDAANDGFEATDNRSDVLRRSEVAEYVAGKLRATVTPELYRAVTTAGKMLGWEPIKPDNKSMFRKVRRR